MVEGSSVLYQLRINDDSVMLEGLGVIVQIDDSLFKNKPKVQSKMTSLCLYCCSTTKDDRLTMNSGYLGWLMVDPIPGIHADGRHER